MKTEWETEKMKFIQLSRPVRQQEVYPLLFVLWRVLKTQAYRNKVGSMKDQRWGRRRNRGEEGGRGWGKQDSKLHSKSSRDLLPDCARREAPSHCASPCLLPVPLLEDPLCIHFYNFLRLPHQESGRRNDVLMVTVEALQKGQCWCLHSHISARGAQGLAHEHQTRSTHCSSHSAISYPKCCPLKEWKLEAPQVPKQTDRAITGLADFLEKQYLSNASESPGPVLLGFHIWSC